MKYVEGYTAGETSGVRQNVSTSDLLHFSGNWIWRAVEALVQAKDFVPQPSWIADRLNISVEAAKDALEGLERIGMVKKTEAGLESVSDFTYHELTEADRADLYCVHTKIRDQIASRMSSKDCFSNLIFLSDEKLISKFYSKFASLIEELNNEGVTSRAENVYAFELSFSRLTRERK